MPKKKKIMCLNNDLKLPNKKKKGKFCIEIIFFDIIVVSSVLNIKV